MSSRNQVTSNFPEIATADTSGNITGIQVGNMTVYGTTTLGSASSVSVAGGSSGEVLVATGINTNLAWSLPQLNQTSGFVSANRVVGANAAIGANTVTIKGPYAGDFQINNVLAFSPTPTNSYVIAGKTNLITGETDITYSARGWYAAGSTLSFFGRHDGANGSISYNNISVCNGLYGSLQYATLGTGSYDLLNNKTDFPVTFGNVYNAGGATLEIVGNGQLSLGASLQENVTTNAAMYTSSVDPFSLVQFGSNLVANNTAQLLTLDLAPNISVTNATATTVSATTVSANTVIANNVGATAVYQGLATDISGQQFPIALWSANSSSGQNYNLEAANLRLASSNDFIYTTSLTKAVYQVSFNVATTGYSNTALAGAYVSITNGSTTSNVMQFLTGSTFNGINYYSGSTTVSLDPAPVANANGGFFTVRLRTPGGLSAGNIDANGSMIITRIR